LWRAVQMLGTGIAETGDETGLSEALALPDLDDLDLAKNTLREIHSILVAIGQEKEAAAVAEMIRPALPEMEKGVGVFPRQPLEIDIRPIKAGDVEPGGKGQRKATFADIIGPLEREIELTRDVALTREEISTLLSAELRLKRELNASERETLLAARETLEQRERMMEFGPRPGRPGEPWTGRPVPGPSREEVLEPEATEVIRNTRTETEMYAAAQQKLKDLLDASAISQDDYNRGLVQLQSQLGQTAQGYETAMEAGRIFASTAASGITDAIAAGENIGVTFQNIARSIAEAVFEMLLFQAIMRAIGAPAGTGPMGGTTQATGLHALFAQHGGPVKRGQPYIVGEAGPELFVPEAGGRVFSNPDTTRLINGGGGRGTGGGGPAGGGDVNVNGPLNVVVTNNAKNTEVGVQESEGGQRLDILIDEVTAGNIRPGTATSRAMRDRFGLNFQTRR
jgi:hypothetical protein